MVTAIKVEKKLLTIQSNHNIGHLQEGFVITNVNAVRTSELQWTYFH